MSNERLTIGELSRRAGVGVKTLRYYSDAGLLPPAGRTSSRYRLYGSEALVRIDLIRTLRDAGIGIDAIRKVLSRELSLSDALRLRLVAVEAQISSLQRVGAALRAALRGNPSEEDVKRIHAMTRLSQQEQKAAVEKFYARVSEGIPIDGAWKQRMIDAMPELPENPNAAQFDAWIELTEIMSDPAFIETLRRGAKEVWGKFDMDAMRRAGDEAAASAKDAIARSIAPESEPAKVIVERYGAAMAAAKGSMFDQAARERIRERFAQHDPRASRYWELIGILKGTPGMAGPVAEWKWVKEAVLHHFA
jgi:DNA-binding transcriptional MerR regulator